MKFNLNIKKYVFVGAAILCLSTSSCINDLDQNPIIDKGQSEIINESDCQSFLAKIYSGFGLSGNVGPSGGVQDLQGPDQGSLCFLRGLLSLELYPTDEALWNWKDEGIVELCTNNWDYTLFYAYTFYQRAMLNIRYCKEFLDNYPEDCGIPNIKQFRDEVRALRAMNYYYLIDVYRNPGWVWDDSPTNDKSWKPSQLGAKEIFDKVVTELKDLSENSSLPEKGTMGTYGRMTKPVVNTLLAKMYLNAEVYTGTPMYDQAVSYANKVIHEGGFGLEKNYRNLFCGENHLSPLHGNEIIFAIPCDGENGDNCTEQGVKTRRDVVPVLTDWNSGYLCHKFTNLGWDQNEVTPSAWPDTDFPLFRLADIYLIYAECAARQATGADVSTAVGYINLLRERANGDKSGNISGSDLTLDFILAERSRELYWEGQRRSDLIRFGKFTKEYAWDYKGGPQEGIANIDSKFNIYPISDKDLTANPNLVQNPGYATLK